MANMANKTNYFEYHPSFLSEEEASELFSGLMQEIEFETHEIKVYGKKMNIPRLGALYSRDPEFMYNTTTYSKDQTVLKLPASLEPILERMRKHFGVDFDTVLCWLYRNGKDYIGWHSDREAKDLPVASLSLGQTRKFRFRKKPKTNGWDYEFQLKAGDVVYMKPECQVKFKHTVPKQIRVKEPRINLTFRVMNKKKEKQKKRIPMRREK